MHSLNTTNNQVVLGVKAGRGFGFLDKSFVIEASLNGHTLETDIIQPGNEVIIGAELLWEAGKKVLKRLRTGNVPLKVDCFTVVDGQKQERVGYVLMALRAAHTISSHKTFSNYSGSWHNMLGVKAVGKPYNPALFLSLCIEEMNVDEMNVICSSEMLHNSPVSSVSKYTPQIVTNQRIVSLISHIETTFLLTVTFEAANLLELLAENEFNSGYVYSFTCTIMGHEKQIGKMFELSSFTPSSNDKFEIKMWSSMENLIKYLEERNFASFKLKCNGTEIACGHISGSCFIETDDFIGLCTENALNNVVTIQNRCYLTKSTSQAMPVSSEGSRPYVDVVITLQYLFSNRNQDTHGVNESKCGTLRTPCMPIIFSINEDQPFKDTNADVIERSPGELQTDIQNWFALKIVAESILFHEHPSVNEFYVRFHHSRATTVFKHRRKVLIHEKEQLTCIEGVSCSLLFDGSKADVQRELLTNKPIVTLSPSLDDSKPFASGSLDMSPLLDDQAAQTCTVRLTSTTEEFEYGVLHLYITMEDVMTLRGQKCENFPFSDTSLPLDPCQETWKQEIEEWKEQQKEAFLLELKQREHTHLNAVLEDWEKQQKESELVLERKVQHCSEMVTALSNAAAELRVQSQTVAQKEKELACIESTLQSEFERRLRECREASRRMEDDFKLEISAIQVENKRLREELDLREEEKTRLLKTIEDQKVTLSNIMKDALTEEQTTTLLKELRAMEEKYEAAYRSKLFFKDQWARVMREIHFMKNRHREEINLQIRSNMEELKYLGKMLPACDSNGHHQHGVREQDPGSRYSHSRLHISELVSNKETDVVASSRSRPFVGQKVANAFQKSTLEQELQVLVQERDSLLNTGTYALDHELIANLNKKIRQILAECNHKFV